MTWHGGEELNHMEEDVKELAIAMIFNATTTVLDLG